MDLGKDLHRDIPQDQYAPEHQQDGRAPAEQHLPQKTDGIDVSPLFFGSDIDTDSRPLYWEFPGKQRALRWKGWKTVTVKKNAPLELYRIKDDPYEQHNVADEHPDIVRQMELMMRQLRTPSPNYPIEGEK